MTDRYKPTEARGPVDTGRRSGALRAGDGAPPSRPGVVEVGASLGGASRVSERPSTVVDRLPGTARPPRTEANAATMRSDRPAATDTPQTERAEVRGDRIVVQFPRGTESQPQTGNVDVPDHVRDADTSATRSGGVRRAGKFTTIVAAAGLATAACGGSDPVIDSSTRATCGFEQSPSGYSRQDDLRVINGGDVTPDELAAADTADSTPWWLKKAGGETGPFIGPCKKGNPLEIKPGTAGEYVDPVAAKIAADRLGAKVFGETAAEDAARKARWNN